MKKFVKVVKLVLSYFKKGRKFEAALPIIFNDIDEQLPALIGVATGYEVEELIGRAVQKATGSKPSAKQVETVIGLYSPIAAAVKAFKG